MGFSPPSGGGGGAVSSVFGRTGAVTAVSGDYTAALVTNAADKSSGTTQAFTATITSNGNIAGQSAIASEASSPTNGRLSGRNDGGSPSSGSYAGGSIVEDFTTPGLWMTSVGGNPPTDWKNIAALATKLMNQMGFTISTLTGLSGNFTPNTGNINDVATMTANANAQLLAANSVSGSPNWFILDRRDNSAFTLIITPNGLDTIMGSTTPLTISPGETVWLVSDGATDWILI